MNKKLTVSFTYEDRKYKLTGYFSESMEYALDIEGNDVSCPVYMDGLELITFYTDEYLFEVQYELNEDYKADYRNPLGILVWSTGDNGVIIGDIGKGIKVTLGNTRVR